MSRGSTRPTTCSGLSRSFLNHAQLRRHQGQIEKGGEEGGRLFGCGIRISELDRSLCFPPRWFCRRDRYVCMYEYMNGKELRSQGSRHVSGVFRVLTAACDGRGGWELPVIRRDLSSLGCLQRYGTCTCLCRWTRVYTPRWLQRVGAECCWSCVWGGVKEAVLEFSLSPLSLHWSTTRDCPT